VLCTDGLLDSENIRGERFGKERLRKAARDRLDKPARAVADGVIEDLLKFTENKQEDDITLLVMKIK
jgi:serine phosphatase RsbU (regulator of sigma subunit)